MNSILEGMKFSANVPDDVLAFLDAEVASGHYRSRSAALTAAIVHWRESRLEDAYRQAFSDVDSVWEEAIADGWTAES